MQTNRDDMHFTTPDIKLLLYWKTAL